MTQRTMSEFCTGLTAEEWESLTQGERDDIIECLNAVNRGIDTQYDRNLLIETTNKAKERVAQHGN